VVFPRKCSVRNQERRWKPQGRLVVGAFILATFSLFWMSFVDQTLCIHHIDKHSANGIRRRCYNSRIKIGNRVATGSAPETYEDMRRVWKVKIHHV
jgi:hypothetical protein